MAILNSNLFNDANLTKALPGTWCQKWDGFVTFSHDHPHKVQLWHSIFPPGGDKMTQPARKTEFYIISTWHHTYHIYIHTCSISYWLLICIGRRQPLMFTSMLSVQRRNWKTTSLKRRSCRSPTGKTLRSWEDRTDGPGSLGSKKWWFHVVSMAMGVPPMDVSFLRENLKIHL